MSDKTNIKIEEMNNNNPFEVPNGYFEKFSIRMSDKISETETSKSFKIERAWLKPKLAFASLAGFAVIIFMGILIMHQSGKPLSSNEMIEAYRYSALQEITDEQLAQIAFEGSSKQKSIADSTRKNNEKEEIIEYLSKENIDINNILLGALLDAFF